MDPTFASKLSQKRDKYRAELATALTEDADPLAAYDSFIKWTVDAYGSHLAQSGLLELLEEATRHFVDDDAYKSDLRYLKLWLLYATHVEDPTVIYQFLVENNIGKIYAQTYQEYADALERGGRRQEADTVYRMGIQRRARPVDPLKRRYEEFKSRSSAPPPKATAASPVSWKDAPPETRALRRSPLKNHTSMPGSSSRPSPTVRPRISQVHAHRPPAQITVPQPTLPPASTLLDQEYKPYAHMLAPPMPGKRKEKLRFNLSLLFTEDGVEYSMQEARARSMGLLGKKWGPPPAPERDRRVGFSENTNKGTKTTTTRKFANGAEPTVTLATKEALADVFGMYNSPEKSMRFGPAAGSKHAPVRKIEPVTPMAPLLRSLSNENAEASAKNPAFRPFVDENAQRENKTPAGPPKIVPFVDPELANKPVVTPNPNRPVLSLKDPSTLGPKADENAQGPKKKLAVHIDSDSKPSPVFSLTPASATFRDRRDVFSDDAKGENIFRPASAGATKFMPFSDENAPKVFSRPVPKTGGAPTPTFTPFADKAAPKHPLSSSGSGRPILGERTPLRTVFTPPPQAEPEPEPEPAPKEGEPESEPEAEPEPEPEPEQEPEAEPEPDTPTTESDADAHSQLELERANSHDAFTSESSEDFDDFDGYEEPPAAEAIPIEGVEDAFDDEDEADRTGGYQAPLGGRFGQFNVMTPITERTFEYTMSTRGSGTPGFNVQRDPTIEAERLAAELQEEDEEDEVVDIEERTGTLSLADALDVASSFKPPNPCNPFDPPIVSTLLRLIPPDSAFHDLRSNEAQQLDALQKFAKKKTRRASGNSNSGRSMQDGETFKIRLHDRQFAVVDKLGEGGFGAVFEAIDLDLAKQSDDDDEEEDDDVEEANRVALKVVKPRNLWEFHVLRRIHSTLSANLRRSIITPQALYAFRDESFLILELRKQGTLLDIVNRASSAGITQQGACLDELLVMFFAIELMRLLEGMHRAGFIHGDMKIDNCLLRIEDVPGPASAWEAVYQPSGDGGWSYKGIKLIDFGRTIDTRLFPTGQRYIAEWPTDARDCLEIREGKPWTFQTDYFGLAGIIYCMLYGKYIEAASVVPSPTPDPDGKIHYKLSTPFKRYWQGDLWARLFDVLLNPTLVRPDGKLPVTDELAVLRGEMEAWLQANCNRASNSLKGLLKKVGLAILGGKG
ncbi:Mad3/BUB1 homology region 1-domain-containing protein [Cerioporus squamosus]|nr:Mad3/BUB1 homology region 1-domain-containing protein [Cerioporus squamosus]